MRFETTYLSFNYICVKFDLTIDVRGINDKWLLTDLLEFSLINSH